MSQKVLNYKFLLQNEFEIMLVISTQLKSRYEGGNNKIKYLYLKNIKKSSQENWSHEKNLPSQSSLAKENCLAKQALSNDIMNESD